MVTTVESDALFVITITGDGGKVMVVFVVVVVVLVVLVVVIFVVVVVVVVVVVFDVVAASTGLDEAGGGGGDVAFGVDVGGGEGKEVMGEGGGEKVRRRCSQKNLSWVTKVGTFVVVVVRIGVQSNLRHRPNGVQEIHRQTRLESLPLYNAVT